MFWEDDEKEYKLVAPDIDSLLRYFDRQQLNPMQSTDALLSALKPLFEMMKPLASINKYDEVKAIWLRIPRGTIEDYDSFEDMKEYGEVKTYEEYENYWLREYPEEYKWYRFVVVQSYDHDGALRYYGMNLGNESVVSATLEERSFLDDNNFYPEEAAVKLCSLIIPAVHESVDLLIAGKYNDLVEAQLPYQFRVGVIKRKDLWEYNPESREYAYDGLSDEDISRFRKLITSGINDEDKISRIKEFTANDFFNACRLGYEAIGKDCSGYTLSELYLHYSDGRDEGLTGKGHGLNAGPGIDFDDPKAWDEWFFNRKQHGGHPWEVVPGGNSTHMELYVRNDRNDLDYRLRAGEISEDEYKSRREQSGYYFAIAGLKRQFESVRFYLALNSAGLPVYIGGAEELLARFEATDYIGIVPHHYPTRYCEDLFPDEYGDIIDFTHVYKDEDKWFEKVEWLPVEPVELTKNGDENKATNIQ